MSDMERKGGGRGRGAGKGGEGERIRSSYPNRVQACQITDQTEGGGKEKGFFVFPFSYDHRERGERTEERTCSTPSSLLPAGEGRGGGLREALSWPLRGGKI